MKPWTLLVCLTFTSILSRADAFSDYDRYVQQQKMESRVKELELEADFARSQRPENTPFPSSGFDQFPASGPGALSQDQYEIDVPIFNFKGEIINYGIPND